MKQTSQQAILDYLKAFKGEKFSADELKTRIGIKMWISGQISSSQAVGPSIYANLRKLRPKCQKCSGWVEGETKQCPSCKSPTNYETGIRAQILRHKRDSRSQTWVYWFQEVKK